MAGHLHWQPTGDRSYPRPGRNLDPAFGWDPLAAREGRSHRIERQRLEILGQMAGGVAHDVNNLLTAVVGFSQLLEHDLGTGTDDTAREDVIEIRSAAERAASLLRKLVNISRQPTDESGAVDVNEAVRSMKGMLGHLVGSAIVLETHLGESLPVVRIDASRMDQVLVNLVVNARDAMSQGGRIRVETRDLRVGGEEASPLLAAGAASELPRGRYALLSVRDTGTGIDAATRRRLFEPYFTTKPPGRGTGLGLATVAEILGEAGGGIAVHSTPGRGSTFRVYLPAI